MATEKTDRELAADKRRQAEIGYTEDERKEQLLAAYGAERQGYVQRGLTDRVKQVDEQIKALGGKAPRGSSPAPTPAA